jgi:hypothetical protein
VFICVKNYIACSELWVDEFEILAVQVKVSDPKYTWEVVGICRTLNEDIWVIENLAARTIFLGISMKRSSIGGYLNSPQVDWKGMVECTNVNQALI